jgi:Ca-activated chloride channel family protein
MNLSNISIVAPGWIIFGIILSIVYLIIVILVKRRENNKTVPFSSLIEVGNYVYNTTARLNWLGNIIMIIFILTLSFTNSGITYKFLETVSEGVVVLVLDVSNSMIAEDLSPNRLLISRQVSLDFVESLPDGTQIGLVFFNGQVTVKSELSRDKTDIINSLNSLTTADLGPDTAIGESIRVANSMINRDPIAAGVTSNIILITDGESNFGLDPIDYLEENDVEARIFTIGVGQEGETTISILIGGEEQQVPIPGINETQLKLISELTDGEYSRADSPKRFQQVLNSIAENSITSEVERVDSYTFPLSLLAAAFLSLYIFLLNWRE